MWFKGDILWSKNILITSFDKHLNQHDVIYLDMMEFADNEENGNKYLENLNTEVVSELKETYPERLEKIRVIPCQKPFLH